MKETILQVYVKGGMTFKKNYVTEGIIFHIYDSEHVSYLFYITYEIGLCG